MPKTKLVTWTTLIAALIVWNLFSRSVSAWIYLSLTKLGFPAAIVELILFALPIILLWEVVAKFLILQAMPPLKFISTQPELWKHINPDELTRYTSELEEIGFVQLTDYTITPASQQVALVPLNEINCPKRLLCKGYNDFEGKSLKALS